MRRRRRATIDGHTLKFTNLGKVFYPDEGYTKRDVLNYYERVARLIVPHLQDRPLSLKRYPDGIQKEFFFQKNVHEHFPAWLRTELIESDRAGKPIKYCFAQDRASLLYLVNLGCIDHNPWMSRVAASGFSGLCVDRSGPAGVFRTTASWKPRCW